MPSTVAVTCRAPASQTVYQHQRIDAGTLCGGHRPLDGGHTVLEVVWQHVRGGLTELVQVEVRAVDQLVPQRARQLASPLPELLRQSASVDLVLDRPGERPVVGVSPLGREQLE